MLHLRNRPRSQGALSFFLNALLLGALWGWIGTACAHAQGCPPGTVHVGDRTETAGDTIIIHPLCQQAAVAPIAIDPNAARLSAAQLRLVDARIAGIQKALPLLGDSNPEWKRERDHVLADMHEDEVDGSFEAVNLISLGLAEWLKKAAQANVDGARMDAMIRAFKEPLTNLPAEEAKLDRILVTTSDPALHQAIFEYKADLLRLQNAEDAKDVYTMAARTRDAAEALTSEFELMKLKPPQSTSIANGLYVSSALVGSVAIIFVAEGPQALAAAAGSAGASIAVGGREAVNIWQEHKQLAALDQQASDRNRMQVELYGRLNDLQQQRDRLVWAVQHATPRQ